MKISNLLLADALKRTRATAKNGVIRSVAMDRATRERLIRAAFLTEVMRGWYLLTNPAGAGSTTLWYSHYWEFVRQYLTDRFSQEGYCLSAESSLDAYSDQNIISQQLVVVTKKPSNQTLELPHGTSVMIYADKRNFPSEINHKNGLNLMPLPEALCRAAPSYFQNNTLNAEICLKLVPSASEISRVLLAINSPTVVNRITGAYCRLGDVKKGEQIIQDLAAAGHAVHPRDPFGAAPLPFVGIDRLTSPYSGRIQAMWQKMRPVVLKNFPAPSSRREPAEALQLIERLYTRDAYNSLSIEGYQVSEDLIRRIKEGVWSPDRDQSDYEQRDALAAKGYLEAFRSVMTSVQSVLAGANPGKVFSNDLQSWYRGLFTPFVQAQLMAASDLAGYRHHQVYISASRHVPPHQTAVLDAMDTLEKLMQQEESAAVRAVLGHLIFVFIHPYMDGNGRIGRFLMNLMLVSGGYNWTVIRTSERARYMAALETASTEGDIEEFARFIAAEMASEMRVTGEIKPKKRL